MYKKFLWFSALTACFITVFFAIFTLTKVDQKALENGSIESCININTPPIKEDSKQNEPLDNGMQPRVFRTSCPKQDKEGQPKTDCETCPKQEGEQEESSKKTNSCSCLKETPDDSTEDKLLITPQLLEQRKHLPHFNNKQMRSIFDFISPLYAKNSFDINDTFDLKFKNAFTVEIIQNRDENGWRFYINGQEVQPNESGTNNTLQNKTIENTPMPLPEFGNKNPILQNKNNMNNTTPNFTKPIPTQPNQIQPNIPQVNPIQPNQTQMNPNPAPIQPNQTQPNIPVQPKPEKESSLLPTKTPYM